MSEDNAQELMEMYDRKAQSDYRRNFIARMEHKLNAKERNAGRSRH